MYITKCPAREHGGFSCKKTVLRDHPAHIAAVHKIIFYWEQAKRGLYTYGVDAWWCDNSEPFNPEWIHNELTEPAKMYEEYCRYVRNHMPVEKSNAYGFYHAMGIYEGQRAENDGKRVVNLTRSAYTGQQRFGAVLWSGDVSALSHHHASTP